MGLEDYMTAKEAAKKWSITVRRVARLCGEGRVPGAVKKGRDWLILANMEKPIDGRYKNGRKPKSGKKE